MYVYRRVSRLSSSALRGQLSPEKKSHLEFKESMKKMSEKDTNKLAQQKLEEKTKFSGATSAQEKEAWDRRMRYEQTMLDKGEYAADPREADASKMFLNQPGLMGTPNKMPEELFDAQKPGPSEKDQQTTSEGQEQEQGKVPLAKITPVKKAFRRKPYIEKENRPDFDPKSDQPKPVDNFSVLDTRLDDLFLVQRKMYESEEGRKLKTIRERITFAYTRNREAIQMPKEPLAFERWLINNEVRKAEFKQWVFRNMRTQSSRNFMHNYIPEAYRDLAYLSRFQNQTGTYMLYFPAAFGLGLSGIPFTEQLPWHLLLLWGSFCLRSSAQIITQIQNFEVDRKIHRQKSRPLATGAVTHQQAYASLGAHLAGASLMVPFLPTSALMTMAAAVPMMAVLPGVNRFTNSEQVVKGVVNSMGVFVGMSAGLGGFVDPAVTIPAFVSCLTWFVYYDTLYAFQDVDNDPLMANKSFIYVNVKPPRRQVMTMNISDRSRHMEMTANQGNSYLFYTGLFSSASMATAMYFAGMPSFIYCSYMAMMCIKHWEVKRIMWAQDARRSYILFKKEQYYHVLLLFVLCALVPTLKFAEELRCEGLRKSTGGTLEFKAEHHHMMQIDKRVRLEDHQAWKNYIRGNSLREKLSDGMH